MKQRSLPRLGRVRRRERERRPRVTKAEKLLAVLSDHDWHSTKDLARRVGHTFGGAKFRLVRTGVDIEKRPHPTTERQWHYRMADGSC